MIHWSIPFSLRALIRGLLAFTLSIALFAPIFLLAQTGSPSDPVFRGGKVEWARLKTSGQHWKRHADFDLNLLQFIRDHTSLNIERVWYSASATKLDELCSYPFLFTDNLQRLSSPEERRNVGEYLRRGGFILIDACVNTQINPNPDLFMRAQLDVLRAEFPDLRSEPLPSDHQIFSIYFKMAQFPPQTRPGNSWSDGPTRPLRLLVSGDRVIGVLTLSGLQCGWAGFASAGVGTQCMQMMTNIYIYAITR